MNRYKKSQSEQVTIEDIISVIDQAIAQNDIITDVEYQKAMSNLSSEEEYYSKAAQVATSQDISPVSRETMSLNQSIIVLHNRGYSNKQIANTLKIDTDEVKKILTKKFGPIKDRNDRLISRYKSQFMKTLEKVEDSEEININYISRQLNIEKALVTKIIKETGTNLRVLIAERRERLSVIISKIVDDLAKTREKYVVKDVQAAFMEQEHYTISYSTVYRAMANYGKSTSYKSGEHRITKMLRALKNYVYSHKGVGVSSYFERFNSTQKLNKINEIIDEWYSQYGKNFGYDTDRREEIEKFHKDLDNNNFMNYLMIENEFADKSQLRDKMTRYDELGSGSSYQQYLDVGQQKLVIDMFNQSISIPEISRQTGLDPANIKGFLELYKFRNPSFTEPHSSQMV
jgi:hypothetical protein